MSDMTVVVVMRRDVSQTSDTLGPGNIMTRLSPHLFAVLVWGDLFSLISSLPNIVMITVENLGWADVSWHNPEVIMPNIATLASSGVRLGRDRTSQYFRK